MASQADLKKEIGIWEYLLAITPKTTENEMMILFVETRLQSLKSDWEEELKIDIANYEYLLKITPKIPETEMIILFIETQLNALKNN